MIFIFKHLNLKALFEKIRSINGISSLLKFMKINKINIGVISASALCLAIFVSVIVFAGVKVGVNVNYLGKNIAVVENESVGYDALGIATDCVTSAKAEKAIESPEFSLTLTVSDKLESAVDLADTILENTTDIAYGVTLRVDGKNVACVEDMGITELLEARRTAFYIEGAQNSAEFVSKVETEEGYYLKSEFTDFSDAEAIINALDVKTVSVVKTDVTIPYKTIKTTNSKKEAGYSAVKTKGENGVSVRTESVEKLNGNVSARTEVSNIVEKAAIDEVVEIGTAVKKSAHSDSKASSYGLICPINAGKYKISSYYGDGRNHKGIDMCANRGTAIFAAGGGTVTYAGYDSDFGYNVIIKHSNGISTRYAHANALCVKKGQVVAQGDMIATVGSTGWSTGNHLHFEVIVNGVRVNPAPYIGL